MNPAVGVVGAGRMGLPLIGHLARKGFRTFATDLDASKRAKVEERGAHHGRPTPQLLRRCARWCWSASATTMSCASFSRSESGRGDAAGRDLCGAEHRASEDGAGARSSVRAERHPRGRRDDVPRRQGGGRGDAPLLRRRRCRRGRALAPGARRLLERRRAYRRRRQRAGGEGGQQPHHVGLPRRRPRGRSRLRSATGSTSRSCARRSS